MKRIRVAPKQIVRGRGEAEAGAKATGLARWQGVSEATLYNWKAKYGDLEVSKATLIGTCIELDVTKA